MVEITHGYFYAKQYPKLHNNSVIYHKNVCKKEEIHASILELPLYI